MIVCGLWLCPIWSVQRRSWDSLRREIEVRDNEIVRLEAEIQQLSADLNLGRRLQSLGAAQESQQGQSRLSISREEARDLRAMSHAKGVLLVSATRFEPVLMSMCVQCLGSEKSMYGCEVSRICNQACFD